MKSYFDIKFKYSLIKTFGDIWNIKNGKIFEITLNDIKECYRAQKLFSWLYNVGTYGFVFPTVILIILIINFNLFESLLFNIVSSFFLYIVLEILLIGVTPMVNIDCLEKKIKDKKDRENIMG